MLCCYRKNKIYANLCLILSQHHSQARNRDCKGLDANGRRLVMNYAGQNNLEGVNLRPKDIQRLSPLPLAARPNVVSTCSNCGIRENLPPACQYVLGLLSPKASTSQVTRSLTFHSVPTPQVARFFSVVRSFNQPPLMCTTNSSSANEAEYGK